MKTSVIVTTYNRPAYLRKVLSGFADQTRLPDEVIVADDGSGPETRALIDELREKMPFPLLHSWHEHKMFGAAAARNDGARIATGDYFIFIDGDCIPSKSFVEDHQYLARTGRCVHNKRIMVQLEAVEQFTGRESFWELLKLWLLGKIKKVAFYKFLHIPWYPFNGKGRAGFTIGVFREDFLKINGWNEDFEGAVHEDHDFDERLERAGVKRWTAAFGGLVFHLNHPAHTFERNDEALRLLEESRRGPFYVEKGFVNRDDAHQGSPT